MNYKRAIGTFLILFSFGLFTWLLWPIQNQNHEIIFEPGDLILNQFVDGQRSPGENQETPVFMEKISVNIIWAPVVRKGGNGTFQLQFLPDYSPTESISEHVLENSSADSSYIDVFEGYTILASARLVMVDFDIDPPGEIGTVLTKGQNASFEWDFFPGSTGRYQGTAWLYLEAFSIEGDKVINQAVSAQDFEVKVISLLGLDFIYIWITAFALLFSGVILSMDSCNVVSDFLKKN